MYFENFLPGTSFEAGRTPRAPESFWAAPGSSVAVPESSGKVAGGCGRVLGEKYRFFIDFYPRRASPNTASPQPFLSPCRSRALRVVASPCFPRPPARSASGPRAPGHPGARAPLRDPWGDPRGHFGALRGGAFGFTGGYQRGVWGAMGGPGEPLWVAWRDA